MISPTRPAIGRLVMSLSLLWLAGAALRLTILAAAPLLPMIHRDLALSETAIGTLGTLPSLLFGFAAVPGSLLVARLGARATIILGLILTAAGSAARGAAPDIAFLYLATMVMGAGIAIMQPAMSPLVRLWLPDRIGFATAFYTNGLLVSEIVAVALTLPYVLPFAGDSWRVALALWSLPVLATALLFFAWAPQDRAKAATLRPARWWPDWRSPLIWRLGVMLGGVNTIYWSANAFLPDYLDQTGRADLVGAALSALNGGQLPASIVMLFLAGRMVRSRASYGAMGFMLLASTAGIVLMPGIGVVWWSALLGGVNAAVLILMLALPPLLSEPDDTHRVAAAMFTVSYPCSVVLPILGGFLWDVTGSPAMAFAPAGLGALGIFVLSRGLKFAGAPK
jgi:CP family cyanate transporter-like MFS transporter